MAKQRTQPEPSPQDIWQTAASPGQMLHAAEDLISPRRLRLYAIACCKSSLGETGPWAGYSELLQLAELMADSGTGKQMSELWDHAVRFRQRAYPHGVIHLLDDNAVRAAEWWDFSFDCTREEVKCWADILREIAGNPFVEIQLDRALVTWRDGTIPKLAQACYDSNDFGEIGILGDALEEAGCSERAILEHLRTSQTHYRGCWVVDLILGKK